MHISPSRSSSPSNPRSRRGTWVRGRASQYLDGDNDGGAVTGVAAQGTGPGEMLQGLRWQRSILNGGASLKLAIP
ncbi:MAG: hypothetical protein IIZ44_09195 [Muribaculaceae bacterium]|nr:hypothetical protein [Muribaculaceae bacterium]